MSDNISTLLTPIFTTSSVKATLRVGARQIDEIFTEDCVLYGPWGVTVAAT